MTLKLASLQFTLQSANQRNLTMLYGNNSSPSLSICSLTTTPELYSELSSELSIMQTILPIPPTLFDLFLANFGFIYFLSMVITVFLLSLASDESPVTLLMDEITKLLGNSNGLYKLFGIVCVLVLPLLPFATFVIFIVATLFEFEVNLFKSDDEV